MAPKSKKQTTSAAAPAEEPEAKKPKTEEEPKEPKFQEPDAPKDNRPALKGNVIFEGADTTLNVVPTVGGKVLACLTDGAMACFLAGARANVAQKAGRYMFEAKMIQVTDPSFGQHAAVKPLMKIGFSTAESSLVLGGASAVYFDSEGGFFAGKARQSLPKSARFHKDQVVAVVLNLDSSSPNANTITLYRDGVAAGEPQPLPEELKGKALFPHVSFRSVTVHVNFGPTALTELPFQCRSLQAAAASDVSVSPSKTPKDGKYEVVMPVAFPDEGTFDWLDTYLEKNPQFVELSDRKIIKWAKESGMRSSFGKGGSKGNSNDRPAVNFGIPDLDNMSVRRVINAVAPVMPRNYLIMQVTSNLIASDRKEALKKFNYPCYKRVARVVMGEPDKAYKAHVQNKLLKAKQAKSDSAWKAKKADEARKKQQEKAKKEADKKKAAAEAAKKAAAAEKAAAEKKEGDAKEEDEKKEDEPMPEAEAPEVEDTETEPPVVELTEEEKAQNFIKTGTPDVSEHTLSKSFGKFTTPEAEEGFDDIQYEWSKAGVAAEYLQKWVLEKKLTTRIEDIKPGKFFNEKSALFTKVSKEWQDKLKAFQAGPKKRPVKKAAGGDDDDVDIFSVTDINDVGAGVPLYEQFGFEDWELVKLRFELCVLVLSFKQDANDDARTGIPVNHLGFYFGKYFKGGKLNPKQYGLNDIKEVVTLVKDVVSIKDGLVVSTLTDELDSVDVFLKLTEEHRRERQRRIDAGDETARLRFLPPVEPKAAAPKTEVKPTVSKAAKPATPASVKPATVAASGGKPGTVAASGGKGKTVAASGKGADAKGSGKDGSKDSWAKGGGKDWGKGGKDGKDSWGKSGGKDSGKDSWGKSGGKDSWGKDGGKDSGKSGGKDAGKKGWGKGKGKW